MSIMKRWRDSALIRFALLQLGFRPRHIGKEYEAGFLHQFDGLSKQRLNTLQGKVAMAEQRLNRNDPRVEKLVQALIEFFYH